MVECGICGEEFDSERGMKIHRTQVHDGEKRETSGEDNEEYSFSFSLSPRQLILPVFFIGLTTGFLSGYVVSSGVELPEIFKTQPEPVELQQTDFPYEDINYGTGSGNNTVDNKTFQLGGEPYIGSEDAELVMIAYEDFQCPFCNRYNNQAFTKIVQNDIRTGNVRYYLKNFPLSRSHPWALKGAIASECALNQKEDAFWVFKHGFFNNQDELNKAYNANETLFDISMKNWAGQAGLESEEFNQCYDQQNTLQEVLEDREEGSADGVRGTPTIFVEDERLRGAQPYSRFEDVIGSKIVE